MVHVYVPNTYPAYMTVSVKSAPRGLPTYYLPIYGKTLQNYFHIWVDPQVPTYLTYLPTYHPNLMAPIVRPPDVFLWSWTSSMPLLRFLILRAGLVRKMGGKWSSNLRTFGLTMRVTAI